MKTMNKHQILDIVLKDMKEKYAFECLDLKEVIGGWQNLKWRVSGSEDLFLKVFSNNRFDHDQLNFIESALCYQELLYMESVKVPKIYPFNKKSIQRISTIHYMLMDYFQGVEKSSLDITTCEIERLGETCAQIHYTLPELSGTKVHTDHLKILDRYFDALDHELIKGTDEYGKILQLLKTIYQQLDPQIFEEMSIGVTHSDFSNDNILFSENDIRIIDFDRCRISYQHQDIGRAIMSYTFNGQYLDKKLVDAFIKGYNKIQKIDYKDIINAIQLIWVIEVPWWMRHKVFNQPCHQKIQRFKEEIIWITKHFDILEQEIK